MEYLFRGKTKEGEWVEGDLVRRWVQTLNDDGRLVSFICKIVDIEDGRWNEMFEVLKETISQWTGHEDKNGVKIFGGDIFSNGTSAMYLVRQVKGGFIAEYYLSGGRRPNTAFHYDFHLNNADLSECEYKGNIYDNPELLEVK